MRLLILLVVGACSRQTTVTAKPTSSSVPQRPPDTVRFVPQLGHSNSIDDVTFSPDGRFFVTGDGGLLTTNGDARVWDTATGLLLQRLDSTTSRIAFDKQNHVVLFGDEQIVVRNPITGAITSRSEAKGQAQWLAVSPDGTLALGSFRDTDTSPTPYDLGLWDARSGKVVQHLRGATDFVSDAAFSPSGKLIVTRDKTRVRIWDAASGQQIDQLTMHGQGFAAFSHDDKLLAITNDDGRYDRDGTQNAIVTVWDLATKTALQMFPHIGGVRGGVFTKTGKLVTADRIRIHFWDVETGKAEREIGIEGAPTTKFALTPDQKHIATISENELVVWDVDFGTPTRIAHRRSARGAALGFSRDDRRLIAGGEGIAIWDLADLHLERELSLDVDQVALDAKLGDDNLFVVSTGFRKVGPDNMNIPSVWLGQFDPATGQRKESIARSMNALNDTQITISDDAREIFIPAQIDRPPHGEIQVIARFGLPDMRPISTLASKEEITFQDLSSDDVALTANADKREYEPDRLQLWDGRTGAPKQVFAHRPKRTIYSARWAGRMVLLAGKEGLEVWDPATDKLLRRIGPEKEATQVCVVDARRILAGASDGTLALWDLERGEAIWSRQINPASKLVISHHRKLAATSHSDAVRVWRIDTGESVTLVRSAGEWIVYGDDGYFDASKNGGSLAAAVDGDRAYRIDQLATRNNRPDLLLERMQLGDAATIQYFRARFERRVEKAGLDKNSLSAAFSDAPSATIVSVSQHDKQADVIVELAAKDALRSYNVWVNGVPMLGNGKPVAGKSARITERIELTAGTSKIEVGATSSSQVESLRAFRSVVYESAPRGDLYYVAFGVSKYRNGYNLDYAAKDVLDLGEVLRRAAGFGKVHIHTFTDAEATVANLRSAKQLLAKAKVDDTVIVFVAGHGLHARDKAATYYFATHETNIDDLEHTAAPFELVEDLLHAIAPRRKLFLMDTCESGEREPGETAAVARAGTRGINARALVRVQTQARPPSPSRKYVLERDRYIYNDIIRRTGAIVLSSSRGSELSYELASLKNGAFTEEILRALTGLAPADSNSDGRVSIRELAAYVRTSVAGRTDDLQHPTIDRDNLDMTIELPLVPNARAIVDR